MWNVKYSKYLFNKNQSFLKIKFSVNKILNLSNKIKVLRDSHPKQMLGFINHLGIIYNVIKNDRKLQFFMVLIRESHRKLGNIYWANRRERCMHMSRTPDDRSSGNKCKIHEIAAMSPTISKLVIKQCNTRRRSKCHFWSVETRTARTERTARLEETSRNLENVPPRSTVLQARCIPKYTLLFLPSSSRESARTCRDPCAEM